MIDSIIHFNPVISTLALFAVWIPLLLLFLYLEWNRRLSFKALRLTLVIMAMLALLLIILKPHYFSSTSQDRYILLTNHFDKKVVDSILSKNPSHQLISLGESNRFKNERVIENRSDLINLDGKISYIIGEGLDEIHLALLKHRNFTFIQTGQVFDITQLDLPSKISVGDTFSIKGTVHSSESVSIQLIGPAGIMDSVKIQKEGIHPFLLHGKMKQDQSSYFTIRTINNGATSDNRIPFYIDEFEKLEILILQTNPSFEIRQLKHMLAEQGHSLQVRTQTSKNNFIYENLNNQYKHIDRINKSALSSKDLLLIESSTLEKLEKNELENIFESVNEGLGVIVLINTDLSKKAFKHRSWHYDFLQASDDTVHLYFPSVAKRYVLKKSTLKLNPNRKTIPVLIHGKEKLSAFQTNGRGKIAVQLLQETYRVRLEGDSLAYSSIWNPLIRQTARKEVTSSSIEMISDFPYLQNRPLSFRLWTNEDTPYVMYEGNRVPLVEDIYVDGLWYGKIWPQKTGWQSIDLPDDQSLKFFVSEEYEWQALRSAKKSQQTHAFSSPSANHDSTLQKTEKAIPPVIFYLSFLLSIGLLWLLPKL